MKNFTFTSISLYLLIVAGCGAQIEPSTAQSYYATTEASPAMTGIAEAAHAAPAENVPSNKVPAVRKIVYSATVAMVVESFDGIAESVVGLTEKFGGFIASANIRGSRGDQREGVWTLRIPSAEYRTFLDSAGNVGEVSSITETTQEVTAEFYDVEARIRNKQIEEQRLVAILEERTGKLDDILSVEKEISRVRGEVEQLEGRFRVLSDMTSYSRITLTISEVKPFKPAVVPTFGTELRREWQQTLNGLANAGKNIVICVVSFGPWLVVFGLPCILAAYCVRQRFRKPTPQASAN